LITVTEDQFGLSERDLDLAGGSRRWPMSWCHWRPDRPSTVQVTINALGGAEAIPFWQALLGYR